MSDDAHEWAEMRRRELAAAPPAKPRSKPAGVPCVVCAVRTVLYAGSNGVAICEPCVRSLSRVGPGLVDAIEWAAKRARRFEHFRTLAAASDKKARGGAE